MIIAQSGGPSAVINASLVGAIEEAFNSDSIDKVYGSLFGIEGILKNQIVLLNDQLNDKKDLELLKKTPAMALGSCRYKLKEEKDFLKILEVLKKLEIGYFFYIGGNDSMDTVDKLSRFFKENNEDIKVVGIPKTIDNDLLNTDHTPGFSSAARYVATSVKEVYFDTISYDKPTVTFVEIMGRNAGWLAASSVMARGKDCTAPHMIYLPEKPIDIEEYKKELEELVKKEKVVVVAVSEGVKSPNGEYLSASGATSLDGFGHAVLKGAGAYLESIAKDMGYKTRTIELSLLQRSGGHLSSPVDVEEATNCGKYAIKFAVEGKTGVMVAMKRLSNDPYKIEYVPEIISNISNKEKMVPQEWIDGNDVNDKFVEYMKPLLSYTDDGIIEYFKLDKSKTIE